LRRIQRVAERLFSEHLSLRHEHVQVPVAVIVEQCDAGRYDFGKIEPARHAVEVDEVEARFTGAVGEPLLDAGFHAPAQSPRGVGGSLRRTLVFSHARRGPTGTRDG
jgi:hypothetical protein